MKEARRPLLGDCFHPPAPSLDDHFVKYRFRKVPRAYIQGNVFPDAIEAIIGSVLL